MCKANKLLTAVLSLRPPTSDLSVEQTRSFFREQVVCPRQPQMLGVPYRGDGISFLMILLVADLETSTILESSAQATSLGSISVKTLRAAEGMWVKGGHAASSWQSGAMCRNPHPH